MTRRPFASAVILLLTALTPVGLVGCVTDTSERDAARAAIPEFRMSAAEADRLREELLGMAARSRQLRSRDYDAMTPADRAVALAQWDRADREHAERVRRIVSVLGWPTREVVGADGVDAAFALIKHADVDPALQEACFPMLLAAGDRGEVSLPEVAYLIDRVRARQGRPQLYGTQYSVRVDEAGSTITDADGRPVYVVPIVEDAARLDERRRAMGLDTWAEQEAEMARKQERPPAPGPRVAAGGVG